jgi:hypothetical protein
MHVTLNIESDTELRAYIKDCIRGQVLAVVREEFIKIVKAEINRKIGGISNRDFNSLQKEAFEGAAKQIILTNNGISDWNDGFINPLLKEVLTKRIEKAVANVEWKKIVDALAKEKVKALIQ